MLPRNNHQPNRKERYAYKRARKRAGQHMSTMTEVPPYPVLLERLKAEYTEQEARGLARIGITNCREHIRQYLRDIYPEYHDRFCDEDYRNTASKFDNQFHPRRKRTA